jgi:hypothetical protein
MVEASTKPASSSGMLRSAPAGAEIFRLPPGASAVRIAGSSTSIDAVAGSDVAKDSTGPHAVIRPHRSATVPVAQSTASYGSAIFSGSDHTSVTLVIGLRMFGVAVRALQKRERERERAVREVEAQRLQ